MGETLSQKKWGEKRFRALQTDRTTRAQHHEPQTGVVAEGVADNVGEFAVADVIRTPGSGLEHQVTLRHGLQRLAFAGAAARIQTITGPARR